MNQEEIKRVEFEKIALSVAVISTKYSIPAGTYTESDHKQIIGVALVVTDTAAMVDSDIELKIDGREVFKAGFEAHLLYCGNEVPPNSRFYIFRDPKTGKIVPIDVDQSEIEGYYQDGGNFTAAYTATFYLMAVPK